MLLVRWVLIVVVMSSYVTVSTKVRRELVERARELGVNVSEVLRRALEEVRRRELELLERRLEEVSTALDRIDIEETVGIIREYREGR